MEPEQIKDNIVVSAMLAAIREIDYLQMLLHRQTASGPCVIEELKCAINFIMEKK